MECLDYLDVIRLLFFFLLLIIILLLLVLLLSGGRLTSVLLPLRCLGVSLLLARPHSAPLGQFGFRPLVPLGQFIFPHGLQPLRSHDLSSALVQLLPVSVCPGVGSSLVL